MTDAFPTLPNRERPTSPNATSRKQKTSRPLAPSPQPPSVSAAKLVKTVVHLLLMSVF